MNPIIKDVSRLIRSLRRADKEAVNEAREILQEFCDSWLISGDSKDLQGAGRCCLSDTDIATGLIPVLDVLIESKE